jgi:hypothetical protein
MLLFQFDLLRCCRDCHEELSLKTANIITALKKESFPSDGQVSETSLMSTHYLLAPESIASGKFDSKSDGNCWDSFTIWEFIAVWSFGIVLWVGNISWIELTCGDRKYSQRERCHTGTLCYSIEWLWFDSQLSDIPSNIAVLAKVQEGLTLSQPPDCPNEYFQLMTECWNLNPAKRPT